jgi:hypothetical protein
MENAKTTVYDDTTPSLRGVVGATLRYINNEAPRTEAGSTAMTTISNATGGLVPNSNETGCKGGNAAK